MNEVRRDKYVLVWDKTSDIFKITMEEHCPVRLNLKESRRLMYDLAKAITEREDYLTEGKDDLA